ncbi:MAG: LptF/LptG family permease [Candidatus Omnitrophota bacterium]
MRILRDYVLNEFWGPFLGCLGVMTIVMVLGNLIKLANMVINRGVNIIIIGKLFMYLLPFLLSYTIPISMLLAALICLGRLSSDNEIIAIQASGINTFRIILPLIIISFILSLFLLILNDRIIPKVHYASRKTVEEIGLKSPAAALEPGTFIDAFQGNIIFIYRIEGNKLYDIRIYQPEEGKPTRTIIAKQGEFIALPERKAIKLKLVDGSTDEPDPENPKNFYKLTFKQYFMTMDLAKVSQKLEKKLKDMTVKELKKEVVKYQAKKVDVNPLYTEIHRKLALSFAPLAFILIGAPLAMVTKRRQVSINFGLGFFIIMIYYLLVLAFQALSVEAKITPVLGMWITNIIFISTGSYLIYKQCVS